MTDDYWMTYAEAAKKLGLTSEGVRALARRQRWPRRSPNAIGAQAWVLVPADRLDAISTDGKRAAPDSAEETNRRDPPCLNQRKHPRPMGKPLFPTIETRVTSGTRRCAGRTSGFSAGSRS
jgi:hypothetical protein